MAVALARPSVIVVDNDVIVGGHGRGREEARKGGREREKEQGPRGLSSLSLSLSLCSPTTVYAHAWVRDHPTTAAPLLLLLPLSLPVKRAEIGVCSLSPLTRASSPLLLNGIWSTQPQMLQSETRLDCSFGSPPRRFLSLSQLLLNLDWRPNGRARTRASGLAGSTVRPLNAVPVLVHLPAISLLQCN